MDLCLTKELSPRLGEQDSEIDIELLRFLHFVSFKEIHRRRDRS